MRTLVWFGVLFNHGNFFFYFVFENVWNYLLLPSTTYILGKIVLLTVDCVLSPVYSVVEISVVRTATISTDELPNWDVD